ncbi:MAG: transcription termination factor Rho, partial [Planctomycetales bacterium]|nr:transcription termination factor Rho [Planctomycetales bacterium]
MAKKKQRTQGRYRGRGGQGNQGNQGGGQGGQGGQGGNRGGGYGRQGGRSQNRRRNNNNYQQDNRRDFEPSENGDGSGLFAGSGVLEMHPNGYGFLRDTATNFTRERSDPFVPGTMIEKFGLREGVLISGLVQPQRKQQGPRLREILDVDGMPPEDYVNVKSFDELTPISPEEWFRLETGQEPLSTRVMDLLTPLGKGQRALIVAPPRTG